MLGQDEERCAEFSPEKNFALSAVAMDVSDEYSAGRATGVKQYPGGEEHQALLIDRKNYLFTHTPRGAMGNTVIFSDRDGSRTDWTRTATWYG